MAQKLRFERNFCVCRLRLIFPARLQASIVSTAKLNFCVRNGNRWTLCVKITDSRTCWARFVSAISRGTCQRRPIFPARLQASIVGTAKLNFCVRNGNRWTLCAKDTDYWCTSGDSEPSRKRQKNSSNSFIGLLVPRKCDP